MFIIFKPPLKSIHSVFAQTESNLSKEMELVIKDIKNTTQKKYMDYGKNPGSPDNDFLFMYSVARCVCTHEHTHMHTHTPTVNRLTLVFWIVSQRRTLHPTEKTQNLRGPFSPVF